jgi:hypothetical protein
MRKVLGYNFRSRSFKAEICLNQKERRKTIEKIQIVRLVERRSRKTVGNSEKNETNIMKQQNEVR